MDLSALPEWTRLVFLAGVFALVVVTVLVVNAFATRRIALRERMESAVLGKSASGGPTSLRADSGPSGWSRLIDAIERRGISLADTNSDALRGRMIAAGYTSPYAPRWYTLIRLVMTLGMPAIMLAVMLSSAKPPSIFRLYLMSAILALLGLYLPNIWIRARADNRRRQIVNAFPDALDLMLVCVEAGLGLEAAFDRVGREMMISHPLLSEVLGTVVLELRAGRSREEALHRMADRVQIDEIQSFATLLIQSDKLGSSIGQTLRIYAAEMREKRKLRAEEKAHRLPVLLSIPLVACMLPVMIGVLMLPAGIRVMRQVLPIMTGTAH